MEQQVQKLRNLFISDLESYSSQIEKDLRELFIGVSYLEEKDRDRILAFSFEYDPEDFVISFQTLGEAGEVLSDFLYLPTERFEKRFPSNKFVIEDESLEDDLYDRDFQEAEIEDMINFLIKMGAKISGKGTSILEIEGVEKLVGAEYTIMSDRVEAATYMIAAAATKGDVLIKGAPYKDNVALVSKMREMGVNIEIVDEDTMRVSNKLDMLKPVDVKTLPHPGFLTDMQSIMSVLTLLAKGTSTITETVFENRFMHVEELRRMNAKIRIEGRSALLEGPAQLEGAPVRATDLRSGAALIIAGLMATGTTKVIDI